MKVLHSGWVPAVILLLGSALSFGISQQRVMELEAPLAEALPEGFVGLESRDLEISDSEAQVAGFTDYALRVYENDILDENGEPTRWASVYLGFYDSQTQGRTIHSPRNCLPGSGWEALESTTSRLPIDGGVPVNQYLLQNGDLRALVLYWYQGRGRVAHDEYMVKWDLFRDAALHQRTDEALARIVVPIDGDPDEALEFATSIALQVIPGLNSVLPD